MQVVQAITGVAVLIVVVALARVAFSPTSTLAGSVTATGNAFANSIKAAAGS